MTRPGPRHKTVPPRARQTEKPREDLLRLYQAAVVFRDLAPWEWMDDDRVFGVEDSGAGPAVYCSVLGGLETVFGLAAYVGADGFASYLRIATGESEPDDFDAGISQDCLLVTFEPRSGLMDRDRREAAELGMTFRGRNAWPLFRSSRPGYAPWYLEPTEVRLLAAALEQAVDVCARIRDGVPLVPQALDRPLLMRHRDEAGGEWRDAWAVPPVPPAPAVAPRPPHTRIERLLRTARRATSTTETALVYLPSMVAERGQRPYFPRVWFEADHKTGIIGMSDLLEPHRTPAEAQEAFLVALEQTRVLPAEIRTASDASFALLAPVAEALAIPLRRVRSTPALDAARHALEAAFSRRGAGAF